MRKSQNVVTKPGRRHARMDGLPLTTVARLLRVEWTMGLYILAASI